MPESDSEYRTVLRTSTALHEQVSRLAEDADASGNTVLVAALAYAVGRPGAWARAANLAAQSRGPHRTLLRAPKHIETAVRDIAKSKGASINSVLVAAVAYSIERPAKWRAALAPAPEAYRLVVRLPVDVAETLQGIADDAGVSLNSTVTAALVLAAARPSDWRAAAFEAGDRRRNPHRQV